MTLVWENEPWWREYSAQTLLVRPWWSIKRSGDNPALLAYYQSETKAARGLWTQIKPGRYLTQECSAWLTAKQIKYWAEWQSKGKEPSGDDEPAVVVLFATTPDEIEHVYTHGPQSCMSYPATYFESSEHPTRIYGAGDLAIAYLEDPDDSKRVSARAICWPERKVFGRVYPTENEELQDELREALHALGYEHVHQTSGKGLDGARMLRIEDDNRLVMPYLDAPYQSFDDHGDYLILRRSGDYPGTETAGLARLTPEYEHTCCCCEEGFNGDGTTVYLRCNSDGGHRARYWCDGCVGCATFYCEGFNESFDSDSVDSAEWRGNTYTQVWLDANTFISDYSGERFSDDDAVQMVNGDTWSEDEFDRYGQVLDGENWPNDDAEIEIERRAAAETTGELTL